MGSRNRETVLDSGTYYQSRAEYTYFGGFAGVGAEHRMSRSLAINVDLRGFVRGRQDGGSQPEFVSADGRATNTSGGVLFNLGASLYF
jgi:hypothetical protein